MPNRWELSKNPFRRALGTVRYRTGLWVERYVHEHGEWEDWTNEDHKIRRAIWEYGINAEGATNCIENPLLGKIIKWEQRQERTRHLWVEARKHAKTPAEKKRVEKLWDKLKYQEAQQDKWLKFEDPDYITRAEEKEDQAKSSAYYREHGEFPKTPPLLRGGKRFTQEEWDEARREQENHKPPIAL